MWQLNVSVGIFMTDPVNTDIKESTQIHYILLSYLNIDNDKHKLKRIFFLQKIV